MSEAWQSETSPPWVNQAFWDKLTDVQRWRFMRRSTISTMLSLARTSYTNSRPLEAKRAAQRVLADIRRTRP